MDNVEKMHAPEGHHSKQVVSLRKTIITFLLLDLVPRFLMYAENHICIYDMKPEAKNVYGERGLTRAGVEKERKV